MKKGNVILVDKAKLESEPFQETKAQQTRCNPDGNNDREEETKQLETQYHSTLVKTGAGAGA